MTLNLHLAFRDAEHPRGPAVGPRCQAQHAGRAVARPGRDDGRNRHQVGNTDRDMWINLSAVCFPSISGASFGARPLCTVLWWTPTTAPDDIPCDGPSESVVPMWAVLTFVLVFFNRPHPRPHP